MTRTSCVLNKTLFQLVALSSAQNPIDDNINHAQEITAYHINDFNESYSRILRLIFVGPRRAPYP